MENCKQWPKLSCKPSKWHEGSEAEVPAKNNNAAVATPGMSTRSNGLALKLPTFNWMAQDTYDKLMNFEMEVKIYSWPGFMISVTIRESQ